MWRNWGQYDYSGPSTGAPNLADHTYDTPYLETIQEVESIKSRRSSSGSPAQQRSTSPMPPTVGAPLQSHPTWAREQQRDNITSPHANTDYDERVSYASEVSPVSDSRKSFGEQSFDETPISPIDSSGPSFANRSRLQPPERAKSQIPRRKVSGPAQKLRTELVEKQETRWDRYTGEATQDDSGVISPVRPGVQPLEQQYPQLKERTRQILADLRERELAKTAPQRKPVPTSTQHLMVQPVQKPPWKGASGRSAIVDPVRDTPSTGPLPIAPGVSTVAPHRTVQVECIEPSPPARAQEPPALRLRTVSSEEEIKPVAPLKIANKSRNPTPTGTEIKTTLPNMPATRTTELKALQSPFHSPQPQKAIEEPMLSARTASPAVDPGPPTPQTPSDFGEEIEEKPTTIQSSAEREVSRFSWTTYNTSVPDSPTSMAQMLRNESPPPPLPPMPAMPKRVMVERFNEDLYMDADAARSQGSIVIRKPLPNGNRRSKVKSHIHEAPAALTHSKTLPALPPEFLTADKSTTLEAELESLKRRKHNINRIVKDLKEDLKKNQITYDYHKRREVEARVRNYERELQELTNEEHEVGLRLHRVQRRRDRDDFYEQPTGLWVKRVTSC